MRENVMNLEVVLADGRVINTAGEGRRTRSEGQINIGLQCVLRAAAISSCLNAPVVSYRVINRSNPSWKLISSIVCMADQV